MLSKAGLVGLQRLTPCQVRLCWLVEFLKPYQVMLSWLSVLGNAELVGSVTASQQTRVVILSWLSVLDNAELVDSVTASQ